MHSGKLHRLKALSLILFYGPVGAIGFVSGVEAATANEILQGLSFPLEKQVVFLQRHLNPMLSRATEQRGTLWLEADGGLVMQVTEPRWQERRLVDGYASMSRQVDNKRAPGKRTATRRVKLDESRPSHLMLLTMVALLQGDLEMLSQHFELSSITAVEGWTVFLIPRSAEVRAEMPRLLLYGHANRLLRFRSERGEYGWFEIAIGEDVTTFR